MSNRIRRGTFTRNRRVVVAAAVFGIAATGAAAAGHAPWSSPARPTLSVEPSPHERLGAGVGHGADAGTDTGGFGPDALTDRSHGGDAPGAASGEPAGSGGSAISPAGDGVAPLSLTEPTTEPTTLPATSPTTSPTTGNPSAGAAPGTAEPIDVPPPGSVGEATPGKVVVASQSQPGFEPTVTAAPTTTQRPKPTEPPATTTTAPPPTEPPPATTIAPTTDRPTDRPTDQPTEPPTEPPTTTTAPKPTEPDSSESPTTMAAPPATSPTLPPAPHSDTVVPLTLSLSCALSGDAAANTVSCSWSGGVAPGFYRYLLLRGASGGPGRVPFKSTDPSAGSFVDSGLAAGQYSYVVVELDSAEKTLGHSNPVFIVVPPAAG